MIDHSGERPRQEDDLVPYSRPFEKILRALPDRGRRPDHEVDQPRRPGERDRGAPRHVADDAALDRDADHLDRAQGLRLHLQPRRGPPGERRAVRVDAATVRCSPCRRRSICSASPRSRGPGTTSAPTCRTRSQPVLHPGTGEPVGPDDLAPLFPMALIMQEVSDEAEIVVPDEVLDIYRLWRPTPLYRAHRLERAVGTRSRIFYKYEGVSPAGSHKPNTAVAQAFYNKQEGRTRLATETGAGPVGERARVRLQADGARVQGLHGSRLVRPEAVPAVADRDVGRRGRREPLARHADAGRPCSPRRPTRREASGSRSPRRSRTRRCARTPRTRSAACSTTSCSTRR